MAHAQPNLAIRLQLPPRPAETYDIVIGPSALERLAALPFRRVLLVTDTGVPEALVREAERHLAHSGATTATLAIAPSERVKTLDTVAQIARALAELAADRSTSAVVALGGGIVTDTAAYAAAAYQRGIPAVLAPTTLLAMVDASVGGKTGVNLEHTATDHAAHTLLKNYLGAFHQPHTVLADTRALASLPPRHLRAGLAECVKHACLAAPFGQPDLFDWTTAHLDAILRADPDITTQLITQSVRLKADIVATDERERAASSVGGRALLNLGHTFAHAIEPIPHLSPDDDPAHAPLHHGEAVALGLLAAAATAHAIDPTPARAQLTQELRHLLQRIALPTRVRGLPPNDQLRAAMQRDKKTAAGALRLILPQPDRSALVLEAPPEQAVFAGLDAIRAH